MLVTYLPYVDTLFVVNNNSPIFCIMREAHKTANYRMAGYG
jgi:hypothetical protein